MQLLAKAGALPARGLQYFISILNTWKACRKT
jgi:hypothetical protein